MTSSTSPRSGAAPAFSERREDPVARQHARLTKAAVTAVELLEARRLLAFSPAGAEFRVSSFTAGDQSFPAVAVDGDGDFVVAWESYGQEGSGSEIYAQRYAAGGAPLGAEFRVNSSAAHQQRAATVAMDADGEFVVAWESYDSNGSFNSISAQRYTAGGTAVGGEFRVNTTTAGIHDSPSAAMDADGDFVIAWHANALEGSLGVYAQRYGADGSPVGGEFHVNTFTTLTQRSARVAMDADGDFVITWQSDGQDGSNLGVYAQRYAADGSPAGAEFRVNTVTADRQRSPAVGMDADGDFVVAWESRNQDGSGDGVFAQRYTSAGSAAGAEFRVNTTTFLAQTVPAVAVDADGDFVVAWQSFSQDGDRAGVYGQRFTAGGVPDGPEFRVNTTTAGDQSLPAVAADADGDFVVAWASLNQDGAGYGVYAQRYDESTDTAGPIVTEITAAGDRISPGERLTRKVPWVLLNFSEDLATVGGTTGAGSATNPTSYRLTRGGADVSAEIEFAAFGFNASTRKFEATLTFAAPLGSGEYVLTARQSLRDPTGNALDGNLDGAPGGGDWSQPFSIETLEVGPEFRVNTSTALDQKAPAMAMDADGDFVVVWEGIEPDGDGFDIYVQRFAANGTALGTEFRITDNLGADQRSPDVAMDADGDFVVVWEGFSIEHFANGILAERFSADGSPVGGEFTVNVVSTPRDLAPTVAMDADGDFVVAWMTYGHDAAGTFGIAAQRYTIDGNSSGQFSVNTFPADNQGYPDVAMDARGDFVIAWTSYGQENASAGIYARRYEANLSQVGEIHVNTFTAGEQRHPAVAMDADGDAVIAWESYGQDGSFGGVYAQRFTVAGAAVGMEFRANTVTASGQGTPAVAMDADGDFVVAWHSSLQDGSFDGVYAQRFNAAGQVQSGEFRVNTTTADGQFAPTVGMDADGDFVIAWHSYLQDGSRYGVYAQRYDEATDTAGPIVSDVRGSGERILHGARIPYAVTAVALSFSEALSTAGGAGGANSATNPANYRLTLNGVDISSRISSVGFEFNTLSRKYQSDLLLTAPLGGGNYVLTLKQALRDSAGNALDGNFDGAPGGDDTLPFSVWDPVPVGQEFRVNTTTANMQNLSSMAMDADGDFVAVWQSINQDGSGYGVYAQRYSAAGTALGGEFRVNTTTTFDQNFPAVAMDADGDFVVAWESNGQDGSGRGVYAQRYSAAGVALGGEFRVNTFTPGDQSRPTAAMDADGDFVVAWSSKDQDGSFSGVYAQCFSADGITRGGEFRVNSTTPGVQDLDAAAMDADGDFVIAWAGEVGGSREDIFAQRYNAAGVAQGAEFRVNTTTTDLQRDASVAMDADGDFVIAWNSYGQDGGGYGIYAQRYFANGAEKRSEFRVNTTTTGWQQDPLVAMDTYGDFVVTWTSSQDGSGRGVDARRYSANGVAGGEFHVNTTTADDQRRPSAAMDADGDFTVAWASEGQDGSFYGIYAQRFGPNTAPTTAGIASVNVEQDAPDTVIDLFASFDDSTDLDHLLAYSLAGNTNPVLFSSTAISVSPTAGTLTLDYAAAQIGQSTITVRATDTSGLFTDTSFLVTVTPVTPPVVRGVYADSTAWTPEFRTHLQNSGLGGSSLGLLIPAGADQLLALPLNNINRVRIVFSEDVTVDQADLSVRGVSVGSYGFVPATFIYDSATFTATWTLRVGLRRDKILLDLDGDTPNGITDGAGNRLDGEWTNGGDVFPTGDGTAGGDFRFRLNVLPGDVDGNGSVTVGDVGILSTDFGLSPRGPRQGDFNGDALVSVADVGVLSTFFGQSLPAGEPALPALASSSPPLSATRPRTAVGTLMNRPSLLDAPDADGQPRLVIGSRAGRRGAPPSLA